MEDDNGLDLSLFLPYGGQSTSFKIKNDISSEAMAEEADRSSKLIHDFKNFLDGGTQKEDCVVGSQRSNQAKPEENLFYELSNSNANMDTSSNINGGFWGKSESRSTEVQQVRQDTGSKRKNPFDEISHQKRHEREARLVDLLGKTGTPHISRTTDEGLMAENEDVADSEAEGSTSKLVLHHNAAFGKHTGNVCLYEGKEVSGVSDSSGTHLQGVRRLPVLSEKEFKLGHASYGVPFSGQSANMLNMTYPLSVKEPNSNLVSGMITSNYTSSSMIQVMAPATNDRPGTWQSVIPATLPLMSGFSHVQMPTVEPVNALKPFEEGSSSLTGSGMAKSAGKEARPEGHPPEHPTITPGIAAELKFGGGGTSPDLPWVSTTGPGRNGRTISGVTYKHNRTEARVVCACHGSHMSVEEFVQHASEEQANQKNGSSSLASFPNSNPAGSAQS